MTPRRKKRLALVGMLVCGVGIAAAITITTLQDNMMFFVSPTDALAQTLPPERNLRLGGLVVEGSIDRDPESLLVRFEVTDGLSSLPVTYTGILPDLFREGQGVVAQGFMSAEGVFEAREVLARHDEAYMPVEVARALEQAGMLHAPLGNGASGSSSYGTSYGADDEPTPSPFGGY